MPITKGVDNAIVSWGNICMPAHYFLLIRRGHSIAALRFAALRRADPDVLIGCAEYELYERSDGATTFRDGNYHRSTGRVSQLESHGIHPFVVQDGQWRIPMARATLEYSPLSCVALPPRDMEMAPTGYADIASVDAADLSLRWFMADPTQSREAVVIPNR
jgi:hypothetical protein